jgi:hypothetical protein
MGQAIAGMSMPNGMVPNSLPKKQKTMKNHFPITETANQYHYALCEKAGSVFP